MKKEHDSLQCLARITLANCRK